MATPLRAYCFLSACIFFFCYKVGTLIAGLLLINRSRGILHSLYPLRLNLNCQVLMNYYIPSDLEVEHKKVLIRVDFNVPIKEDDQGNRVVVDDTRIRAALPTIRSVLERNGKVILISHLGRPKGVPNQAFSLSPVALKLEELLGKRVRFASHLTSNAVKEVIERMPYGSVILLENTRFHPGEKQNDSELAKELAGLADYYVNDAFGSAHRAHASTEGVAHNVPIAAMGYLLQREVEYLSKLLEGAESPYVGILGGAKVSDKIGVIESLLDRVDHLTHWRRHELHLSQSIRSRYRKLKI